MRDDATATTDERPPTRPHVVPDDGHLNGSIHNNQPAELAVLGAILLHPTLAATLRDHLEPADFYRPAHETIWNAIHEVNDAGILPDPITVSAHLQRTGELKRVGGAIYLHDLMQACPNPLSATWYAEGVRNAARIRNVGTAAARLQHIVNTARPDHLDSAIDNALQTLDDIALRVGPASGNFIRVPTIDDILAGDDQDDVYDWVIPGLIEHQERIIITADEGVGKSTLLRQIGVTTAAGIHPFTGDRITPQRVLHVDVENSLRQSRRRYRPLRIQAGKDLDPDNLRIEIRMAGIDLTSPEDVDWLLKTTSAVKPDLLLIGPIYKLANGDPTEETSAKPVAIALDMVRERTDCALILEAHVPKPTGGSRRRAHEPYGWSGWMRWPEIGLYLDKDGSLTPWRGAREERSWPADLERGGQWPWSPAFDDAAALWQQIQAARTKAKKPLSQRELVEATGMSKSTIQRLIGEGGRFHSGWSGVNNNRYIGDTE